MQFLQKLEIWFVVGSQSLYGKRALEQVSQNAKIVVNYLNSQQPFLNIKLKPVATSSEQISALCQQANNTDNCVGVIVWLHTFSPAKMWISGLAILTKPLMQLHTQFNREIPYQQIDMDYMNLHQTAHGDREFGFLVSRLSKPRTIVVGHWQDVELLNKINRWQRVCSAIYDQKQLKIARFGDNMRDVAVTEGDKVEAQIKFGYQVNGFGLFELTDKVNAVSQQAILDLVQQYEQQYDLVDELKPSGSQRQALLYSARLELGLKSFLSEGGFKAFTDSFENLQGLQQLPGLAVQRLMQQGYGFGAEGDWKTAALVRAIKVMSYGLPQGCSFMEDYTYHLEKDNELVLGSHMLEICPSVASERPKLAISPLAIGGKADPVRLVFRGKAGNAVNATIVDMGTRFRMVVADIETVPVPQAMPKLPTGHIFWQLKPNFDIGTQAWILTGGSHHSVLSLDIDADMLMMFAEYFNIEFIHINQQTQLNELKNQLRWNAMAY